MTQATGHIDRITEYERAVCYYTLPRLTYPLTSGLIGIYFFVLIEAFVLLAYGFFTDAHDIMELGLYGAPFMVVLGIVVFTGRSLLNQYRTRKVLTEAANAPKVDLEDSEVAGIPSPFESHHLVQRLTEPDSDRFECRNATGNLLYTVTRKADFLVAEDEEGVEIMQVRIDRYSRSFSLSEAAPGRVSVLVDGEVIATLRRKFALNEPTMLILCSGPAPREYYIRKGSIYLGKVMVGRVYELRKHLYLDVEKKAYHPALLAAFLVM
jgi:hypothetical protein